MILPPAIAWWVDDGVSTASILVSEFLVLPFLACDLLVGFISNANELGKKKVQRDVILFKYSSINSIVAGWKLGN